MGLSIGAFARLVGVSHEAIRKGIRSGRVVLSADGSIDEATQVERRHTTRAKSAAAGSLALWKTVAAPPAGQRTCQSAMQAGRRCCRGNSATDGGFDGAKGMSTARSASALHGARGERLAGEALQENEDRRCRQDGEERRSDQVGDRDLAFGLAGCEIQDADRDGQEFAAAEQDQRQDELRPARDGVEDQSGGEAQQDQRLSLTFQDALAALNPVYPVGWQIAEAFRIHGRASRSAAARAAVELMRAVGIPGAEERAGDYPHQFSGGMCQRIMIAMAIALGPDLVIADEPTTALDVTIQAQIVELLKELRRRTGCSLVLVTHDLGLVAEMADRVVVMYGGRVVEEGDVYAMFADPLHPYTQGLLAAQPRIDLGGAVLTPIPGSPPNPAALPSGCVFHPRCPRAEAICAEVVPAARTVAAGRRVACHFAEGAPS